MPNFGEKLKQLRIYKGLTQDDLANIVKSSKQVISRYEKGYRSPDISIAKNWADALNIPVRYLVDDSLDLISFLQNPQISKNNLIPLEKIKKIPVLGKIACGTPILAEQNIDGYILLPNGISADYALNCDGDSMVDAGIYDGDVVFIKEQPMVENGEIAAILIDGETTLKKVYKDKDKLSLIPANSKYAPLTFVKNEINMVSILGKATAYLHKIE